MIGTLSCKISFGEIPKKQQLDIYAILNNMEKYTAFMPGKHLVFLDSFQFMGSSLEKLADNLPENAFKSVLLKYSKRSN